MRGTYTVVMSVQVTKREKRACARCEELRVNTAPVPVAINEKGPLAYNLAVETIISNDIDHVSLYRQAVRLGRDVGVEISQSTLSSLVLRAGELLLRVVAEMKVELLVGGYIQADETTVPVQSDGYAAYENLGFAGALHFGCFTHARRRFFDASKLDSKAARSVAVVRAIGTLYEVEHRAREANLCAQERERGAEGGRVALGVGKLQTDWSQREGVPAWGIAATPRQGGAPATAGEAPDGGAHARGMEACGGWERRGRRAVPIEKGLPARGAGCPALGSGCGEGTGSPGQNVRHPPRRGGGTWLDPSSNAVIRASMQPRGALSMTGPSAVRGQQSTNPKAPPVSTRLGPERDREKWQPP